MGVSSHKSGLIGDRRTDLHVKQRGVKGFPIAVVLPLKKPPEKGGKPGAI